MTKWEVRVKAFCCVRKSDGCLTHRVLGDPSGELSVSTHHGTSLLVQRETDTPALRTWAVSRHFLERE